MHDTIVNWKVKMHDTIVNWKVKMHDTIVNWKVKMHDTIVNWKVKMHDTIVNWKVKMHDTIVNWKVKMHDTIVNCKVKMHDTIVNYNSTGKRENSVNTFKNLEGNSFSSWCGFRAKFSFLETDPLTGCAVKYLNNQGWLVANAHRLPDYLTAVISSTHLPSFNCKYCDCII
ncbi:hypothetical protein J6590_036582 [Homalodisca vitripennis]|nr:hypothetical protein J6590_036582 [Homalodisca vitripennis]